MHQLDFTQNLEINPKEQISPQLSNQLTPLFLKPEDDLEQRKKLITLYKTWLDMILKLGEFEHSSDWDPASIIILNDQTRIGDEPGYEVFSISGDNLLLEHPNENGESPDEDEDCYYTIPIMDIESVGVFFH